jgi:hypothetical protein
MSPRSGLFEFPQAVFAILADELPFYAEPFRNSPPKNGGSFFFSCAQVGVAGRSPRP